MKKIKLITLSLMCLPLAATDAFGAFLIDEDSGYQSTQSTAQTHKQVRLSSGLVKTPSVATNNPPAFGQVRTIIKHKGRKPAVFGKSVVSQSDATLASLVADVLPEPFQAFASENVDMSLAVKGGKAENWVAAISVALRDTDYMATIDWNKREIMFELKDDTETRAFSKIANTQKTWKVNLNDGLLSRVLSRWCTESGGECVRFINQSSNDMEIDGDMEITGDFNSAVGQLMSAVSGQVGAVFQWKIATNKILILSDDPSASSR